MSTSHQRISRWFHIITLLCLVMLLSMPTLAQEATSEPVSDPVETVAPAETTAEPATDAVSTPEPSVDSEPAEETTDTPVEIVTDVAPEVEVTAEAPDVAPEATSDVAPEATDEAPSEEPVIDETPESVIEVTSFASDFENGTDGLTLIGWAVAIDEAENNVLISNGANNVASVDQFAQADSQVSASFKVDNGNVVILSVRGGAVQAMFDAYGNTRLYVDGEIVDSKVVNEVTADEDGNLPETTWYNVTLTTVAQSAVIGVNGVDTIIYSSDTLTDVAGAVAVMSGVSNEGQVAIDNFAVATLDRAVYVAPNPFPVEAEVVETVVAVEPEVIPDAEITPEPEVTPDAEITPEPEVTPDAEITPEPEVTPDAEITPEPEVTPDAEAEVEEETTPDPIVIASADFESDSDGLTIDGGASVVETSEENNALLMVADSSISADSSASIAVQLDTQISFLADGNLSVSVADGINVDIALSELSITIGEDVQTSELGLVIGEWANVSVFANASSLSVSINDEVVASVALTEAVLTPVSLSASANIWVDDIVVTDLAPDIDVLATATPDTEAMQEALATKATSNVQDIVNAFVAGDSATAISELNVRGIAIDELGRVNFLVWSYTPDDAAELVVALGGAVEYTERNSLKVFIGLDKISELLTSDLILAIEFPRTITSTGPIGDHTIPNTFPTIDYLNVESWHVANVKGSGVDIAVVDLGFQSITTINDLACSPWGFQRYGASLGTGSHGLLTMEVICDIAPESNVYAYVASSGATMAGAIAQAITDGMDVIVITMDLGATYSAGDGSAPNGTTNINDPYYQITQARNAGIPVIVSAGNNATRSTTFSYNGTSTDITINMLPSDKINVTWSAWGEATLSTRPNFTLNDDNSAFTESNVSTGDPSHQFSATGCNVNGGTHCSMTLTVNGWLSGSGTVDVQVQVVSDHVSSTLTPPAGANANAGSLARPADSADAITVGAACSAYENNHGLMDYSSYGPVFNANGAAPTSQPTYTGANVKPEILSLSHVYTSRTGTPTADALGCQDGFGGTSAAAAHVGGMVALMKSNTTNTSMNTRFNGGTADAVTEVEQYLMTRAADMPFGASADGFDRTRGAGLSILGSPTYNLDLSDTTFTVDVDTLTGECSGYVYVGQSNHTAVPNGTIGNPYTHISEAFNAVTNNQCVIVLPGEYPGMLLLEDRGSVNAKIISYNEGTSATNADSIFILSLQYRDDNENKTANLYFTNTNSYTLSGFTFIAGAKHESYLSVPQTVAALDGAQNVTLRNNTISNFTVVGRALIDIYQSTVNGTTKSENIVISDNTFDNNVKTATNGGANGVILTIDNVNGSANSPVLFSGNTVTNNRNDVISAEQWRGIIYGRNSHIDVVSNEFQSNIGGTILDFGTASETSTEFVNVVGNAFMSNTTSISGGGGNSGGLVNLFHVRNISFLSNTVVLNNARAIIYRGDNQITAFSGQQNAGDQVYSIYNNLFYNNTTVQGLVIDEAQGYTGQCGTNGSGSNGFEHNWVFGTVHTGGGSSVGGDCNPQLNIVKATSGNITVNDPSDDFLGYLRTLDDADDPPNLDNNIANTEPIYYALGQLTETTYSEGIDFGDASLNSFYDDGGDSDDQPDKLPRDLGGNVDRIIDTPGHPGTGIDLGAYEFSPLEIKNTNFDAGTYNEDDGVFQFNVVGYNHTDSKPNVRGGFGALTFTVSDATAGNLEYPAVYGTHCGPQFTDENYGIYMANGIAYYCPPQHFYTDSGSNAEWPDNLSFKYLVEDEGGSSRVGSVTFTINEVDDPAIATVPTEALSVTGAPGSDLIFQLQPNVVFSPNFEIVGLANSTEGDFPYTYSNAVFVPNPQDPDNQEQLWGANTLADISNALSSAGIDGEVTISIPASSSLGYIDVTYTVRDADNATASYKLRINVSSQIPKAGIYDDASFAFTYHDSSGAQPGGWYAVGQTAFGATNAAFNNTLHSTTTEGDYAQMRFEGTGFGMYMFREFTGGAYEIQISSDDGASYQSVSGNWTLAAGSNSVYTNTIGDFTCTTTSQTDFFNPSYLTNGGGNGRYTINCDHNTDTNDLYYVRVISRASFTTLSVDGFSITNDTATSILRPGIYDVDHPVIRSMFNNTGVWEEYPYFFATNGVAYRSKLGQTGDLGETLTFQFSGGTGFALGVPTNFYSSTYRVCVEDKGTSGTANTNKMCQHFDTAPAGFSTFPTWETYVPFYGYDSDKIYEVTIDNINVSDSFGAFEFDDIVIFEETDKPLSNMSIGAYDNSDTEHVFYGFRDRWVPNYNDFFAASEMTSHSMSFFKSNAGPFVAFTAPGNVDTMTMNYSSFAIVSRNLVVCVDRALAPSGSDAFANCIMVNPTPFTFLNEVNYQYIDSNGDWVDGTSRGGSTPTTAIPTLGSLVIEESMFRDGTWGTSTNHTFEIFSLVSTGFPVDQITVLDSTAPLGSGFYNDLTSNFKFYVPSVQGDLNSSLTESTPVVYDFTMTYDQNDWNALNSSFAFSDSGSSIMNTQRVGATVYFQFTGTGFAPQFRFTGSTDEIQVCWRAGTHNVDAVLAVPDTCQKMDTNVFGVNSMASKSFLGLANGTYSVAIRMLPDNGIPTTNFFPVEMWFDGVTIVTDDWAGLTPLSAGTKYETNYDTRVADNRFQYFSPGSPWQHLDGFFAFSQSNNDFDRLQFTHGGTIVFKTTGANALRYIRDNGFFSDNVTICWATTGNASQKYCTDVTNQGFFSLYQLPSTIYFDNIDGQGTADRIVTIMGKSNGTLMFDAFEPVLVGPLNVGFHDDTSSSIFYKDGATNVVNNGQMDATDGWTSVGSVSTNQQTFNFYQPVYSRQVVTTDVNSGIESDSFTLEADKTYSVVARVLMPFGFPTNTITASLVNANDNSLIANGTADSVKSDSFTATAGNFDYSSYWQTIRFEYTPTSQQNNIQLLITASNASEFYVDDVHVTTGSSWSTGGNFSAHNQTITTSSAIGSEAEFQFIGTGFSLGMEFNIYGGEVEVCYVGNTVLTTEHCVTYDNEVSFPVYQGLRSIVGLPQDTYTVTIRDVENGYTSTSFASEIANRFYFYSPSRISLDFVQIYDNAAPVAITESGTYNESDLINNNQLQLLPENRWAMQTGPFVAAFASGESFATVINPDFSFPTISSAGEVAVVTLDPPDDTSTNPNEQALIILDTENASFSASNALMACLGAPDNATMTYTIPEYTHVISGSNNCFATDDMRNSSTIAIGPNDIPALGSIPDGDTRTLTLTTLRSGEFEFDGLQVLYGDTLEPGFYEDSIVKAIATVNSGTWDTKSSFVYSSGSSFSTASSGDATVSFKIANSTGFSILTTLTSFGGDVDVRVFNTDGNGDVFDETFNLTTYQLAFLYQQALTIAGLPKNDYTVEITKKGAGAGVENVANDFDIDGIYILGDLSTLGSLYDDAQVDSNGKPYLTFAPESAWTFNDGFRAFNELNRTKHTTITYGATVSFQIDGATANGIMVYYTPFTSANPVDVCWTDMSGNGNTPVCENDVNFADFAGTKILTHPNGLTNAIYSVSIINKSLFGTLEIDAIQVMENELVEGIFDGEYLQSLSAPDGFTNNAEAGFDAYAYDSFSKTQTLDTNDTLQFVFTGVGFAIELTDFFSPSYNICAQAGDVATPDCSVINENIAPPYITGNKFASYFGLHDANGDDATYTVRLTVTGNAQLDINNVHVMGDGNTAFFDADANNSLLGQVVENDSSYIRYFPFGSSSQLVDRFNRASGGSQQDAQAPGSSVYFEYKGANVLEYATEMAFFYSGFDICYGEIGDTATNSSNVSCVSDSNDQITGYQIVRSVDTTDTGANCTSSTHGCWVSITNNNTDFGSVYFDFLRIADSSAPLNAGYYEENHYGLDEFNSTLSGHSNAGNTGINATSVAVFGASGGEVRRYTDDGSSAVDGGMYFQFTGTGYSIYFNLSSFNENVRTCYAPTSAYTTPSDIIDHGQCITFDNQVIFAPPKAARRVVGLEQDTYAVVVQMLADDQLPRERFPFELPITMEIDAVQIHNDNISGLNTLVPGTKYETSYENRESENNFIYYGDTWQSWTSFFAFGASSENYDQIFEYGGGIAFKANNANSATIYLRAGDFGYAPLHACALRTASDEVTCTEIQMSGLYTFGTPFTFSFGSNNTDEHIVWITSLDSQAFDLDAIEVIDSTQPLTSGTHQNTNPAITYHSGGGWQTVSNFFSDGSVAQSNVSGAVASFSFTGTGASIRTITDLFGGEMEVCYDLESNVSDVLTHNFPNCFTYQQESSFPYYNTNRLIAGLPVNTYTVRIKDVEDGYSTIFGFNSTTTPRFSFYEPVKMSIDSITVLNDTTAPTIPASLYNENATDNSNNPYLQLVPSSAWGSQDLPWLTFGYMNSSYSGVLSQFGSLDPNNIGAGAIMNVNVPAGDSSTAILYTGPASFFNSDMILVCAGPQSTGVEMSGEITWNGTGLELVGGNNKCVLKNNSRTENQIVVSGAELAALNGIGGTATIMFTPLSSGAFAIDSMQVIEGTILTPGVYEDFLGDDLLNFTTDNNQQVERSTNFFDCTLADEWCSSKDFFSASQSIVATSNSGATLDFNFSGTGFALYVTPEFSGIDVRVCYVPVSGTGAGTAADIDALGNDIINGRPYGDSSSPIYCETITTSTASFGTSTWESINQGRTNPFFGNAYGFAYYGMADRTYAVEVRVIDTEIAFFDQFKIDQIAIFSDATDQTLLQPGYYDSSEGIASYEPTGAWEERETFSAPPWGFLEQSAQATTRAGSIAQFYFKGNSFTLYQEFGFFSSSDIRACLVVQEDVPVHCTPDLSFDTDYAEFSPVLVSNFGQDRSFGYAIPVMFYGLGPGEHTLIFENRDHNRSFTIDAILIQN